MPRWREYMEWVDGRRASADRLNPEERALERRLVELVRDADAAHAPSAHDMLPWCDRAPRTRRLYAGLVSFVDDYVGPYPDELFPHDAVHALRLVLRARERVLRIDEQLEVALETTGGRPLAASILLHAVTRQIARDRDARALGALEWDERLRDAAWIAPFAPPIAGGGDPPGDTYHYWANFAVGLHAGLHGRAVPRAVGAAFHAGPIAMTWIRGGLFGSVLFAGAHALCDRMGAAHGRAVARVLGRVS